MMSRGMAIALTALALTGCGSGADDGLSADEERRLEAAAERRDQVWEELETPVEEPENAAAPGG